MKKTKLLGVLSLCCVLIQNCYAYDTYKVPETNTFSELHIYNKDEQFSYKEFTTENGINDIQLTKEQKNTVIEGTKIWSNIISNRNFVKTPIFAVVTRSGLDNAMASSEPISVDDSNYTMTLINARILNKNVSTEIQQDFDGLIITDVMSEGALMDTYKKPTALHQSSNIDLTTMVVHELEHALGVYTSLPDGQYIFPEKISNWDSHIAIYNTSKNLEIFAAPNIIVKSNNNSSATSDFDVTKYAPYFSGTTTMKVLAGDRDGSKSTSEYQQIIKDFGGLVNYSLPYADKIKYPTRPVSFGLPLDADGANLSHIELRNSLMSHQLYRNWKICMEAELASLIDLGYDINLSEFFGKSLYLSGKENNFIETNLNTDYLFSKDYAVGVHVYGDYNKVIQNANITSSVGAGIYGARIEGVNNEYVLNDGKTISISGNDSIGLGASYGKNHKITLNSGSKVSVSGQDSIALSFDFGKNVAGEKNETQGSFIHFGELEKNTNNYDSAMNDGESSSGETKKIYTDLPLLDDINGALVNAVDIFGTVEAKDNAKNAIYISDNAYVETININNGATIKGDIVSDWNSTQSGQYAKVQTNGIIKETALNFVNYGKEYTGNITGSSIKNTLNVNVSGNLTYNTGRANVKTFTIANGAEYSGNATVIANEKFVNNGTYNTSETTGASIVTSKLINNGEMNIQSNFLLNNDVTKDEGKNDSKINIQNAGTTLYINNDVTKISSKISLAAGTILSTIGDKLQNIKIEDFSSDDTSKLSFNIGDVISFENLGDNEKATLFQVKVTDEIAKQIAEGTTTFRLFDDNKVVTLTGSANIYIADKQLNVTQDGINIKISENPSPAKTGLSAAVCDPSAANYLVLPNEVQTADGGTVKGNYFEISGEDIDFGGHKGLIIDGGQNDITYLSTGIKNVIKDDSNYKAAITVKNNGYFSVSADDKDINIHGTTNDKKALNIDSSSTVILDAGNNSINVSGDIVGETGSVLYTSGRNVTVHNIDPVIVQQNADTFNLSGISDDVTYNLNSGVMNVVNDSYLSQTGNNVINFEGGYLSVANGAPNDIQLKEMNLNQAGIINVDMDLKSQTMDRFKFLNSVDLQVNDVIVINPVSLNVNTALTDETVSFSFVDSSLNNDNFRNNISYTEQNILTPVFKYGLSYQENTNGGNFVLSRGSSDDYSSYNPSIFASSVAAQMGGYAMQSQIYEQAFANMDQTMLMTKKQRQAMKFANKYASTDSNATLLTFSPNQIPEESKGLYFRPFASFEKADLKNGSTLENTAYGSLFGGDSDLMELSHGWDFVWGAYAGYIGSHQNYDGGSIYQNGGTFGLNANWYKGDFFTGLTANVSASVAEASTMYGHENVTMLMTGIASKTGYNFELCDGKFIIQPSLLMSYSFVNSFDYTNAAGVSVHSSPLNVLQLAPGLKFIGNLPHVWQPYLSVQMVWNIMDDTKVSVNDFALPEMSINPYVQYGVGLQKRWGDRFTGYAQAMMRNGGRNGVALSVGFRWSLGK